MRPRHRAATVRLSPEPRCRMTRLCCSHDKDKLHPLENISSFFFFPSRLLHTSFFMPLGVVQMYATLKGDDEGGVLSENILEGNLAPHRSQVSHWTL